MVYIDTIFKVGDNSDFYYLVQEDGDSLGLVELSYVENNRPTVKIAITTEIARTIAQKILDMADILDNK